ncbi:Hvo_1808 family surface protein [Halopiger thermotolerans]
MGGVRPGGGTKLKLRLVAVVALVLLAGCTVPSSPDEFDTDRELGQIGDYSPDDEFTFDATDGLTESQLRDLKYRSMARIEVLRGLKFEHDVRLEVIDRSEFREQRSGNGSASAFENELWRGAFVVDGETDVARAMDDLYGSAVQGYYVDDRIVIVTDDSDEIRIDRRILVHELVHALQDQRFGLGRSAETLDERRAETGLIEGEASYVPQLYAERCGAEWQCLSRPGSVADARNETDGDTDANASSGETVRTALEERPYNVGLFLSIYAPYSEGPTFVDALYERDGWAAVDRAHDQRPASTTQLIHPDHYPDVEPVDVEIDDRSSDAWDPVLEGGGDGDGDDNDSADPRAETVGEATLFATLWADGVVDRPLMQDAGERSPYNYSAPATAGWAGDTFHVYQDDENRTGHVWRLAWESEADADEFAAAYRSLLETHGGERVTAESDATAAGDVYRIPEDEPFAGAYRLTVTGDTVEIVGAPTVDALEGIHAAHAEPTPSAAVTAAPGGPSAASAPA